MFARISILVLSLAAVLAAGPSAEESQPTILAFVNARIIDGAGGAPIVNGAMVVEDGRIVAIGPMSAVRIPAGATRVSVAGRTMMPGLINAHGHVGDVRGLKASPEFYTPEYVRHQLALYARYGVTTVFSLGGDGAAGIQVRHENSSGLARLLVAGPVIAAADPVAARTAVDGVKAMRADIAKIRVDDNLGAGKKMPPEAYRAAIERAHAVGLKVAAHIFYLQDAKDVLAAGGDFIAHSVRDLPVDDAFVEQLRSTNRCLSPTLMRDVSTFVYESRPAFFDDSFFKREVPVETIAGLQTPEHQASNRTAAATRYRAGLEIAKANLKRLKDAGVRIAMGTDTGPVGRFQGYFEHLELEQMVQAGLTPMQAIVAATGDAARCMNIADRVGTLRIGLDADFLLLDRNPLDDIANTRTLESVWVRGYRVPR
jgi:imidazolonepropionase-like amidohydrolase